MQEQGSSKDDDNAEITDYEATTPDSPADAAQRETTWTTSLQTAIMTTRSFRRYARRDLRITDALLNKSGFTRDCKDIITKQKDVMDTGITLYSVGRGYTIRYYKMKQAWKNQKQSGN